MVYYCVTCCVCVVSGAVVNSPLLVCQSVAVISAASLIALVLHHTVTCRCTASTSLSSQSSMLLTTANGRTWSWILLEWLWPNIPICYYVQYENAVHCEHAVVTCTGLFRLQETRTTETRRDLRTHLLHLGSSIMHQLPHRMRTPAYCAVGSWLLLPRVCQ